MRFTKAVSDLNRKELETVDLGTELRVVVFSG